MPFDRAALAAALRDLLDPALPDAEFAARLFALRPSLSFGNWMAASPLRAVIPRVTRLLLKQEGGRPANLGEHMWLEDLIFECDGIPTAISVLKSALDDPDSDVRTAAFESYVSYLANYGEHNPAGSRVVIGREMAEDFVRRLAENPAHRALEDAVPGGLTRWPTRLAVPTAGLCRPDRGAPPAVRAFAAASLEKVDLRFEEAVRDEGRQRLKETFGRVAEVLAETAADDPDGTVRVVAAGSLAALRTKELIQRCHPAEWAPVIGVDPNWRTSDVLGLLRAIYATDCAGRVFDDGLLPILADAVEDAGCPADSPLLAHARSRQPHGPGCWVLVCLLPY